MSVGFSDKFPRWLQNDEFSFSQGNGQPQVMTPLPKIIDDTGGKYLNEAYNNEFYTVMFSNSSITPIEC